MFKPWTPVTVERGTWEARAEYRKDGKASGRLAVTGLGKELGVDLSPTGGAFKAVAVPLEALKHLRQRPHHSSLLRRHGPGRGLV
jgi:hypothetical protein